MNSRVERLKEELAEASRDRLYELIAQYQEEEEAARLYETKLQAQIKTLQSSDDVLKAQIFFWVWQNLGDVDAEDVALHFDIPDAEAVKVVGELLDEGLLSQDVITTKPSKR